MKKYVLLLTIAVCLAGITGCNSQNNNETIPSPTGYPSNEIQQPQIMYNGQLYFYFATGFDTPLPNGYERVGSVTEVDNVNGPDSDFEGARLDAGQEVYADKANTSSIYIKYDNGYAEFITK